MAWTVWILLFGWFFFLTVVDLCHFLEMGIKMSVWREPHIETKPFVFWVLNDWGHWIVKGNLLSKTRRVGQSSRCEFAAILKCKASFHPSIPPLIYCRGSLVSGSLCTEAFALQTCPWSRVWCHLPEWIAPQPVLLSFTLPQWSASNGGGNLKGGGG